MEDNALYAFHNHEVTGSIPVPATTRIKAFKNTLFLDAFFISVLCGVGHGLAF